MSATNPLRTKDLIRKYGWTIMPYLSGLSPDRLAEAQILFVDSGATNALDADDTIHGFSFDAPLATIDYAIGLCTANEGSIILVAPGHAETKAASGTLITCDVAGITIIGIGKGAQRPTITLTHTGAVAFGITAASVTIDNILVYNNVDGTVKAISITGTDCTLNNIELRDAAADKEMKIGILTDAADRLKINGLRHKGFLAGDLCTESIRLDGLTDAQITNSIFFGVFSTSAINIDDTACVDVKVTNCYFRNGTQALTKDVKDTATGSTWTVENCFDAVGSYGISGGDGATIAADDVSAVAAAVAGITNSVTATIAATPNAKSVQDILCKDASLTYTKTTDSLEAISEALAAGTGCSTALTAGNLDYLALTTTGVNADGNLSSAVADKTILSHIMTKGADTSEYKASTDSLEALSEAIAAINLSVTLATAVSQTPTPRSIYDIMEKDANGGWDDETDSLQAISDKLGAYAGTSGAGVAESIKASLTLAHTDLDDILADTKQIADYTLPADPVAKSLARYIASGGTALGQQLPGSMSLVDLIGNYTGGYDDNQADDNIKAHLDLIKVDTDKVGTISNAGGTATIGGVFGAVAGSTFVTRFGNIQTEVNKIGTIVNEGGAATIGGVFGDFANSSLVTRLGNIQTEANKIGTISNEGGTATIGAVFGAMANSTVATRFAAVQTEVDKIGTISNEGGVATIGGALGTLANSSLVARLDIITADTAAIDPGAKRLVQKSLATIANGANALFTVSALVKVKIWGVVTSTLENKTLELKLVGTATTPGVGVDITAVLDCDQDAAGTLYKCNTSLGGALVAATNGVVADDAIEVLLPAGAVALNSGAAGTGQITWYCQYEPLIAGATVTAAA